MNDSENCSLLEIKFKFNNFEDAKIVQALLKKEHTNSIHSNLIMVL